MPKVPEEQTPTFATNVPSVAFPFRQEFGKVGEALQRGGEQLENAGVTSSEMGQRVQATKDLAAGSSADIQDRLDADQAKQQINQQAIGGMMYDRNHLDDAGNPTPILNDDGKTQKSSADAMQDWFKNRFNDTQNGLTSDNAKAIYRNKFQDYAAQQLTLMRHDSMQEQVKYSDQQYDNSVSKVQTSLIQNPDLNNLYGMVQGFNLQRQQSVTAGHHTNADIEETGRKTNEQLSLAAVQGAWTQEIDNNRGNPGAQTAALHKWIDILNGKDPLSQQRQADGNPILKDLLSPHDLSSQLAAMENHMPEARKSDLRSWDAQNKNNVAMVAAGKMDPQSYFTGLIGGLHNQVLNQDRDPYEAGGIFTDSASKITMGLSEKTIRAMPPDKAKDVISNNVEHFMGMAKAGADKVGFPSESIGYPERAELLRKLDAHADSFRRSQLEDSASYIAKIDPDSRLPAISAPMATFSKLDASRPVNLGANGNPTIAQAAFKDMDAKGAQMHIPPDKISYLPKEESGSTMNSGTLAHTIKDESINGQTAWNNLAGIKKMAGNQYYPKIMDQMISEQKLPAEWGILRNIDANIDPRTGQRMVDAIRTSGPEMDKIVEGDFQAKGQDLKDFDQQASKAFSPAAVGMEQANPFSLSGHNFQAGVIKAGTNLAKMYYHENPELGIDSAIQRSYNDFIGDNTWTKPTGANGLFGMKLNGMLNIPKFSVDSQGNKTPITERQVDNALHFMADKMSFDNLSKAKIAVPAGADESQKANFPAYIEAHEPRATYFYQGGKAVMGITYQGPKVREPVMLDSHTPYTVPFSDASKESPANPMKNFDPDSFAHRQPASLPTDANFEKSFNENLFHQYSSKPDKAEAIRKVVGHLTGEAPLNPEEASKLMYPPSEREKLQQTYAPAKPGRTNDQRFMDMMERRKNENIG